MKYRGHDIAETRNVMRYERVDKFTYDYSNEIHLDVEELDDLKDLIRKKEAELEERGGVSSTVTFKQTTKGE